MQCRYSTCFFISYICSGTASIDKHIVYYFYSGILVPASTQICFVLLLLVPVTSHQLSSKDEPTLFLCHTSHCTSRYVPVQVLYKYRANTYIIVVVFVQGTKMYIVCFSTCSDTTEKCTYRYVRAGICTYSPNTM